MPDRRYPHGVFLLWAEQQGNGSLSQMKQHVCLFRAHAVRSEILLRKNIYLALHEKIRHKPDLLILQGAGPAPGLFIQIISEIM